MVRWKGTSQANLAAVVAYYVHRHVRTKDAGKGRGTRWSLVVSG